MIDIDLKPWDLAAIKIIVEEAGGRFTDFTGQPTAFGGSAIASNGLRARRHPGPDRPSCVAAAWNRTLGHKWRPRPQTPLGRIFSLCFHALRSGSAQNGDSMVMRRLMGVGVAVVLLAGPAAADRWTEADFDAKARMMKPYVMVASTDPAVADTMIGSVRQYSVVKGDIMLRLRRPDAVVALTDPPFIDVTVSFLARLRGVRTVRWMMDVYPDVAMAAGALRPGGALAGSSGRSCPARLRRADAVVLLGRCMRRPMLARGVGRAGCASSRTGRPKPWNGPTAVASGDRPARPLTLLYSGTYGVAHDLSPLIEALRAPTRRRRRPSRPPGRGRARPAAPAPGPGAALRRGVASACAEAIVCPRSLAEADLHVVCVRDGVRATRRAEQGLRTRRPGPSPPGRGAPRVRAPPLGSSARVGVDAAGPPDPGRVPVGARRRERSRSRPPACGPRASTRGCVSWRTDASDGAGYGTMESARPTMELLVREVARGPPRRRRIRPRTSRAPVPARPHPSRRRAPRQAIV